MLSKMVRKDFCNVGIEIECFIKNDSYDRLDEFCISKDLRLSDDGSIHQTNLLESNTPIDYNDYNSCEIRGNGFITNSKDFTKLYNLFQEIKQISDFRVNSSCGLHIHLSFKDSSNYYKLFSYDFSQKFEKAIKELFKTDYEKLRLDSRWCRLFTDKEHFTRTTNHQSLAFHKTHERYHNINFNSYKIHKTIEFRIFPASENKDTLKKYVEFLVNFVKDYLENQDKIEIDMTPTKKIKNKNCCVVVIKSQSGPSGSNQNEHNTTPPKLSRQVREVTRQIEQVLNLNDELEE